MASREYRKFGGIYLIQFNDGDWIDFRIAELESLLNLLSISADFELEPSISGDRL